MPSAVIIGGGLMKSKPADPQRDTLAGQVQAADRAAQYLVANDGAPVVGAKAYQLRLSEDITAAWPSRWRTSWPDHAAR
jgi:hypothetical protein